MRRIIVYILLAGLLAACQRPAPEFRLVADPLAPPPPPEPAFTQLPGDAEVREALQRAYPRAESIRLVGPANPEVVFLREDTWSYWVYHRKSTLDLKRPTKLGFEIEERRDDALRWEFWSGRWQPGGMWHGRARYRGIPDPSPEQIAALLKQGRIEYHRLDFASLPMDVEVMGKPGFARDGEGYGELGFPVEYRARAHLADFGQKRVFDADVTLRTRLYFDLVEERWKVNPQVELVRAERRGSQESSFDDLLKRRWQVEQASRR